MFARPVLALAAVTTLFAFPASGAHAAEPIAGRWVTEERDAIIEIKPCGRSTCGTIARFLVPPPDGADQRDINNPDPQLRRRTLLGLPVLTQFSQEDDVWRGRIYDPKRGRTFRSVVRRLSANKLEVKGCFSFICQTQTWTKAR